MPEYGVKITGLTEALRQLKAVQDFLRDPQPMQDTVDDVKDLIIERTADGKDFMGRNFAPYSKAYAKRKHKTKVDLRETGEMLNSIKTKVDNPHHGQVFVSSGGRSKIAAYHNEGSYLKSRLPQRRFMDISRTQLLKIVKKNFDDVLMRILGRR
jgi:hypothetical protein